MNIHISERDRGWMVTPEWMLEWNDGMDGMDGDGKRKQNIWIGEGERIIFLNLWFEAFS